MNHVDWHVKKRGNLISSLPRLYRSGYETLGRAGFAILVLNPCLQYQTAFQSSGSILKQLFQHFTLAEETTRNEHHTTKRKVVLPIDSAAFQKQTFDQKTLQNHPPEVGYPEEDTRKSAECSRSEGPAPESVNAPCCAAMRSCGVPFPSVDQKSRQHGHSGRLRTHPPALTTGELPETAVTVSDCRKKSVTELIQIPLRMKRVQLSPQLKVQ